MDVIQATRRRRHTSHTRDATWNLVNVQYRRMGRWSRSSHQTGHFIDHLTIHWPLTTDTQPPTHASQ